MKNWWIPTCRTLFLELPTLKIPTVCKPEWGKKKTVYIVQRLGLEIHTGSLWKLKTNEQLTIFLNVLTAAVDHPRHLTVDGIETQPFISVLFLFAWRFSRQGELQRLEETRLVVIQVCDGVHRHATLVRNNEKKGGGINVNIEWFFGG